MYFENFGKFEIDLPIRYRNAIRFHLPNHKKKLTSYCENSFAGNIYLGHTYSRVIFVIAPFT